MTTLDAKVGTNTQTTNAAAVVEQDTTTLITEQQVMFASAAALAPAPARHRGVAQMILTVRAAFGPRKPRARSDYPRRYQWLETSLMAREMDRL